ncbi:MAG TPA: phage holin family protein [Chitinophagaceae bacterium]
METDTLKDKTEELTDHLGDYAETFIKLTLVKATEKGSSIASAAIITIILCGLGLFGLFFAGLALSWWIGNLINSRAGGFLIIAGFFLVLFAVIWLTKKKTVFPFFRNLIIRKAYE